MKSSSLKTIAFSLFAFLVLHMNAGSVPFNQIGSTSKSSNTGSGNHWLSAGISASNWYFVSKSKSGSPSGTWTTDTSKTKTATFNLIHKPGTFAMSISGRAEPSGGSGGGSAYSLFSVNKSVPLSYAISPSSPDNVPCGESSELINFKENGVSISAYWKAVKSGDSGSYGTTLISSYYFSNSTPGIYNISAKRDEATGSATIKNIGVESISGHGKTSTESAEANLGDDETIFCAPYIDASLTANTDPSGQSWPTDEPTWHCQCSWPVCQHLTTNGASCVFNSSGSGAYIVRAECGNSYKRIKIENLVPKLYSVEFTDDITIKRDTGTQDDYENADWVDANLDGDATDAGDTRNPVAYVSTNKCKVGSAVFKLPNSKSYDVSFSTKVRFDTSFWSSYSSEVTGSASGSTITCSNVQFPDQFIGSDSDDSEVGHDSSYSTRWDISFNDGDNWTDIDGDTSNELYLTWKSGPSTAFETVLHIGCTKADGETTRANIISDIWTEFTDCSVKRKGTGTPSMTYWGSAASDPTYGTQGTAQLLRLDGGRCGDWAPFFADIVTSQGINSSSISSFGTATTYSNVGFLVKSWSFTGSGTSGDTNFPYIYSSECTDLTGVAGQGNSNPRAFFWTHALVWDSTDNKLYDPSYGSSPVSGTTKTVALASYRTTAFDGFFVSYALGTVPLRATSNNTAYSLQ